MIHDEQFLRVRTGAHHMSKLEYHELPLMRRSALMHAIDLSFNSLEEQFLEGHTATLSLAGEFSDLAARSGATFVVAAIREGGPATALLRWAGERRIPAVDISVDLSQDRYRNLPHDRHPSPLANEIFARKLGRYLRTVVEAQAEEERQ